MSTDNETDTDPVLEAETPPEVNAPQPAPEEQPLDAVIIIKRTDANGYVQTEVVPNGAVQVTEVQTLIELGLKFWRKQLDLA